MPGGFNAFAIKTVVGDKVALTTVFRGLMPFIVVDIVVVALLILFPRISHFLPSLLN